MINKYENKMVQVSENKSMGISEKDEVAIENFFRALQGSKKKSQAGRKKSSPLKCKNKFKSSMQLVSGHIKH